MKVTQVETKKAKLNFEDVLQNSGGFGRFQLLILVGLLFAEIPAAFVTFSPVFVGLSPETWLCENVSMSFPEICECRGTLETSEYSIVTEWGLICGSSWVSHFITSIQMLGMLLGSLFSSQISDWYGRKWVYLGVCIFMAGGQLLSAFAPNPIFYALARFIAGAGISGFMGMSTIYPLEFMTSDWRILIGSVGPWGEGIMLFALLGYWIQPWRELLIYSSLPFALLIFILPWIPESPRYLLRKGKITETVEVIQLIQKVNGELSTTEVNYELLEEIQREENTGEVKGGRMSYLDFFRTKDLRNKTLILMGIWFSWSLVYFGISYNITSLPGNIYMNVFLMGLSDAMGYPAALLINNKLDHFNDMLTFRYYTVSPK